MADPVGVGIVGAGYWGTKLAQEYLSSERSKGKVKLVKVCDSSLTALLACKDRLSIDDARLARNVGDLMEDPKISAVHIATPNQTHYALAKIALQAGKDVLLEKPMTLSSGEAYELVYLAASRGRVLHVGHIFRFNSALRKAREMLDSGVIGKIFYARIQWTDSRYFPDRDIIFDVGPHPVDVLNQLLNAWPTRVGGFARAYRNSKDHEEIAYGLAEFDDDIFAHLELSWLYPGKVREASIIGSEGALVVDCLHQRVVLHTPVGIVETPVTANNAIESEIDWFLDCVSRRRVSVESGLIGAKTIQVLEAMRRSMWERPLPIIEPVRDDHTAAMVSILQSIGNGIDGYALTSHMGAKYAKSIEMMLGLGLARSIVTSKGTRYQVTENGLRFLREYADIGLDVKGSSKSHQEVLSDRR